MTPCIIGWAHSAFGKREEPDVEALMATVAADALAHAGVEPADVGAVHVGVFNAGFSKQDFFASMVFQALPALRFTPATRHENACATGSAAIHAALAAWETYERLGSPEGELAIAQAVLHLASAPKSNAAYVAWGAAQRSARETGSLMPPKHILNAPTRMMKELGYAEGYEYDHDTEEGFSGQDYFPEEMARPHFYRPTTRGREAAIAERLAEWDRLRRKR